MSVDDRHINFKLMREWILTHQDKGETRDNAIPTPMPADATASGVTLNGKKYWRSLEELADTPEFHEFVQREYPQHAEEWDDPIERRSFLKLMGASLALAGLSGCVYQPPEKIVPFVRQSEESIPGKALFFATAATVAGIATPLLIRSNEGRPTKAEGNPDHPYNRGADANDRGSSATDIFAQASILGLYDPERSDTVTYREEIRTWTTFLGEMRTALDEQRPKQGAGLRFLTETITSPTIAAQLKEILTEFPQAKVASIRTRQSRQHTSGRDAGFRTASQHDLQLRSGNSHSFTRCRFPFRDAGNASLRAAVCRRPSHRRR